MAAIDLTDTLTADQPFHLNGINVARLSGTVDFSENNRDATEIIEAFDLPAGWIITHVAVTVLTAEGGAATVDVGVTGSANLFHDDLSINSTAGTTTISTTALRTTEATKLIITANTASTDAAVLRLDVIAVPVVLPA